MKTYQKAELIAKNLPTGSYAAGCPVNADQAGGMWASPGYNGGWTCDKERACQICMRAS